jgi:hypothetical protein
MGKDEHNPDPFISFRSLFRLRSPNINSIEFCSIRAFKIHLSAGDQMSAAHFVADHYVLRSSSRRPDEAKVGLAVKTPGRCNDGPV